MGDPRPIGFFDSGVGGLTVLREVSRRLPGESTVYLGDNARTPYGPRPDDEVVQFSSECLDELTRRDVKALVVACNTSTAVALPQLRRRYGVPILGVVRPGATAAKLATRTGGVGVIATPATIRSHAYFEAIKEEDPFVEVYELATPELVPLVEAGMVEGPIVDATVRRSLAPLLALLDRERDPDLSDSGPGGATPRIDTLLLGCTHYPLIASSIRRVAGEGDRRHRFGRGDRERPCEPARGPRPRRTRRGGGPPRALHDRGRRALPRHRGPALRPVIRWCPRRPHR